MSVFGAILSSIWTTELWCMLLVTYVIVWYVRSKRYNLPPRPYSWPIVGNLFAVPKTFLFEWCQTVSKQFGPVFRLSIGTEDAVFINDIRHAQMAFMDRSSDFSGRPQNAVFELTSEGYQDVAFADPDSPLWAKRRKLLATALRNFSTGRSHETRTFESFAKLANLLDDKVEKNEAFDPQTYCKLFMYNQIAGMCFSKSYEIDDPEFQKLIDAFEKANEIFLGGPMLTDLFPFLTYLPFETPDRRKIREIIQPIHDAMNREIEAHKRRFTGDDISDLTFYVLKIKAEDETMREITDVHLRQIIEDVFAAGVDTSQVQFRWIILCLAVFPDVQEKLYNEILQVLGPLNVNDTFQGVSSIDYKHKMPYSEAVLLEATRFGVVAPFGLPRKTICDTKIGEYDVPKNTQVFVNQYAINYDEMENKNPHDFDPTRFLSEDGSAIGPRPASFMSFGLGRRSCPGETASRNTLWMAMVMMIRRYRILPPKNSPQKLEPKYTGELFGGNPVDYKIMLEYRQ